MTPLRLGPLLRYVDEHSATVWVETTSDAVVSVIAGAHRVEARTFAVHGHHYALVELDGLPAGAKLPYTVAIDGEQVWPPADSAFPPPVVATLEPGKPLRLAFGSCRVSVGHSEDDHATYGVDALRAYALRMAGLTEDPHESQPDERWPDLLLLLGDQVYADETSEAMRSFIASRRDPEQPPGWELQDYEEYAHLYLLAWSEPANRWLLSTVPTSMIFDDHDIRDDWNTSMSWRREMEATSWWHGRIVAGLASYWVHQHLGNLGREERAADEVWRLVTAHEGPDELDLSEVLDRLAERVDREPDTYRWSHSRDFDTQARLVVVDSRAARVLDPEGRSMLDAAEMRWLDDRLRGGVDHLLIGTSLPFLLAPALHHGEAVGEALAQGAWGRLGAKVGERLRRAFDLEHWAAFERSFVEVSRMVLEVAAGERGAAPRSVTFLSGDVHHSYVADAWPADGRRLGTRIMQAVCSPIRNPLPRPMRIATGLVSRGTAHPTGRLLGGKVPRSPLHWRVSQGPWFDNNLAVLELRESGVHAWWSRGEVVDGDHERPVLRRVAVVDEPT